MTDAPHEITKEPAFYIWDHGSIIGGKHDTEYEIIDEKLGDAPQCPTCRRYVGRLEWLPPHRVRLIVLGREGIGDVAFETGDPLVSARFRAGYDEFGLTGLNFDPVEIVKLRWRRGVKHGAIPDFFRASVARGNAAVDVARSEMWFGPVECQTCRSMRNLCHAEGVVLEPGTWDGLDVFIPRGMPGTVLVTDRFREMCRQYAITNVKLIRTEEYRMDSMPWLKPPNVGRNQFNQQKQKYWELECANEVFNGQSDEQ